MFFFHIFGHNPLNMNIKGLEFDKLPVIYQYLMVPINLRWHECNFQSTYEYLPIISFSTNKRDNPMLCNEIVENLNSASPTSRRVRGRRHGQHICSNDDRGDFIIIHLLCS